MIETGSIHGGRSPPKKFVVVTSCGDTYATSKWLSHDEAVNNAASRRSGPALDLAAIGHIVKSALFCGHKNPRVVG